MIPAAHFVVKAEGCIPTKCLNVRYGRLGPCILRNLIWTTIGDVWNERLRDKLSLKVGSPVFATVPRSGDRFVFTGEGDPAIWQ